MRIFACVAMVFALLCVAQVEAGCGCSSGGCSTESRIKTRSVSRHRVQAIRPACCSCGVCACVACDCNVASVVGVANVGTVTERHRSTVRVTGSGAGNLQAWAEAEAKLMAERGTNGHVMGVPGPGYFVGVGANGMTCRGNGTLVAEAHYRGKTVRVWR